MNLSELDGTFLPFGAGPPREAVRDLVQIAGFQERSLVAGPGERAVIWVAGCRRRCPGCFKPEWFSFDVGEAISVEILATRVLAIDGINGVTYSGGEPFEQSEPLAKLSRLLRSAGLSVLSYSGYRFEALQEIGGSMSTLLAEVDILIDGEYRHDLRGEFKWRGSSNQRVHLLTAMANHECESIATSSQVHEIQVTVENERDFRLTGFPTASVRHELAQALKRRGIELREAQ